MTSWQRQVPHGKSLCHASHAYLPTYICAISAMQLICLTVVLSIFYKNRSFCVLKFIQIFSLNCVWNLHGVPLKNVIISLVIKKGNHNDNLNTTIIQEYFPLIVHLQLDQIQIINCSQTKLLHMLQGCENFVQDHTFT